MIVGLTGLIGSGKSTLAKMLATWGARVINADNVAREVVEPESDVWREIVGRFGRDVLREDGTLDRRALGRVVFEDAGELEALNRITHPPINKVIRDRLKEIERGFASGDVVILDAPLLLETGLVEDVDMIVVVTAPDELRLERLVRQGLTEREAKARMKCQTSGPRQLEMAGFVIENSGTLKELYEKAAEVWAGLTAASAAATRGN